MPYHRGRPAAWDVSGGTGDEGQGPFFRLWFVFESGVIRDAYYETYECKWVIAAGAAVVKLIEGRTPAEAREVSVEEVEAELGGIPRGKRFHVRMVVNALRAACSQASVTEGTREKQAGDSGV